MIFFNKRPAKKSFFWKLITISKVKICIIWEKKNQKFHLDQRLWLIIPLEKRGLEMTKDLIRLQNWIYGNTLNWKLKSHSVGIPRKDETKLKKKIHYLKSSKVFKEHDSGIEFIHHENHNWIHFVLCNCSNISGWINRKCFVDAFLGEISLFLILSETLKSSDIERDFSHFNRPFISFCWWIVRFNYPSILMGKIFIAFDNLDMINLWQKWKKFINIRRGLA